VLNVKLPHLAGWTDARRRNAALYDELLGDVPEVIVPTTRPGSFHVYNQYTIRARRRDELRAALEAKGIGSGVYYPLPLHLQECFRPLGYARGDFPVAEQLSAEVLSLPVYPELGERRVRAVVGAIREFYGL
jgi:dTDP-4-amino-4,6-dideoxygalactose transaminase